MTPRRSSRARTSQPSPAIQHTNSSSSSQSMTRERSTRSNHKNPSPRSQSTDDADKGEFRETRQRQRARGDDEIDPHSKLADGEEDDLDDEEEDEEEEEITRCLCGQQDYPGLPPSRREVLGRNGARGVIKDESSVNISTDSSDSLSDDIGSMFIQCDSCKVWQHGGCVGIMDEAMSPDEYFCEECRKDLHQIRSERNGQYSSQYLPVAPTSSAVTSRESSRDNSKRTKEPKQRHSNPFPNPKRRSTMNSRDAAYDEEEQLRRAIEESKEDNKIDGEEGTRRAKRSRSGSEAHRQATKRPRTSSPSPDINTKQSNPGSPVAPDDESKSRPITNGNRKQRASSRGQGEKDTKEPEEPEAEQTEVTSRRKGKTDRRKGDGADPDHEMESPTKATAEEPDLSHPPSPEGAAPAPDSVPVRPSTRKSGRPPARRGRVGRNQYTRDRDVNGTGTDSNTGNSPRRGQSLETAGDSPKIGSVGTPVNGTDTGKPSRPRYVHQRTTMNEMKRRVAAILEFISRMQVEMAVAGENTTPPENGDQSNGAVLLKAVAELQEGTLSNNIEERSAENTDAGAGSAELPVEKDFKDLSSLEMMDVLTRNLLKWQQEYGKFGER
ncbi:putative transcriptional regulator (Cti6) [Aspergillus lucknowensis]|uniref:Zinc finger PHD-type domain-containing protein n=1 Tax=Aspergillus lucknowensis TaxID=176173 RepID=A0ABR4LYR6_9EURO